MIKIREANWQDLEEIVQMGHDFLRGTQYVAVIKENPEQMQAMAARLLNDGNGVIFVAQDGFKGPLVGMIGMMAFPHPISAQRVAAEVFWWVTPEARGTTGVRLLKRAEQWAKGLMEAEIIQLVGPTPEVCRLYEKLGYGKIETLYQRKVR